MKILKASAGSGKTYRLSNHYIDLLLQAPRGTYPYRHILAVTFTNKATAEMKGRILKKMAERAAEDDRAKDLLIQMLHDYGAFSISTIDRFFQQALKSFSREIGQFSDYQIDLDKDSLVEETMDRILDSIGEEDGDLVEWIRESLSEKLAEGENFSIEYGLKDIGSQLKKDEFRELSERMGDATLFGKEELQALRKRCREIIRSFTDEAQRLGYPVKRGEPLSPENKKTLFKSHPDLAALFDSDFQRYNTASRINGMIYRLGLAGEFERTYKALLKEKNVLGLDESNVLLRDIIAGSDAPFVYEKLGVRYDHFLLDEFQDTSHIQWANFLPLLRESESRAPAEHIGNLVVGDVKQSIYRWRDCDWKLLDSQVQDDFPQAQVEQMGENWRSSRTVVDFNSKFFQYAAEQLGLGRIYADVRQEARADEEQAGFVQVSFVSDDPSEAVLESIRRAREKGARLGDIAVLVRKNSQGGKIARYLIDHGIDVISDDSLSIKSSLVVRRLVSLLSCYDNPDDEIGRFLADEMHISFPQEYRSLEDFCERLLLEMQDADPDSFDGQLLFVQAFLDDLQGWTQINGNNLRGFLAHFNESASCIRSPEDADAVRVITIHKSKGLEFPYVIFPYAETVELHATRVANYHWCYLDDKELGGVFPVDLRSGAAETFFADDLREERSREAVDNLNLFYVALTRAGKCLHVISKCPSESKMNSIRQGKKDYGSISEILFTYLGDKNDSFIGEVYDFNLMKRAPAQALERFSGSYVSFPLDGRLAPSRDADDFFGEDGCVGMDASPRLRGIVLHDILSRVVSPADLDAAVSAAVRDGQLDAAGGAQTLSMLRERIAAHPEWFPPQSPDVQVLNERPLYDADGSEHRPDRVILRGRTAEIVDFKFGREKESYGRQIRTYARLWHELGYDVKGAYLWYVEENKVV